MICRKNPKNFADKIYKFSLTDLVKPDIIPFCVGWRGICLPERKNGGMAVLDELNTAKKVVGVKQLRKALSNGLVTTVFLAKNADPGLTEPLAALCEAAKIPVVWAESMQELGTACRIAVGAAAAGILRE